MKKFNELSENIIEDEYRNNGRYHYSDISGYARKGFSYIVNPEKEESESLSFGSVVDCIVTKGINEFNSIYCVERNFDISENQKSITRELSHFGYDTLDSIPRQTILEAINTYGLYKNYKEDTKINKIINDCGEYYRFLMENVGKVSVEFPMYNDAVEVANKIVSSQSGIFFSRPGKDVDIFHQLIFNGEIDGIPVTCMVDSLYVDHSTKKIYPVDLKTTCANYEWDFAKSFVKWRYDIQAKLYSTILRQVMDSDPDYRNYELTGFVFVYVSRQNKTPIAWVFNDNLSREDIVAERKDGTKLILEDFRKPLKEMFAIRNENLTIPPGISLSKANDVLEHIIR